MNNATDLKLILSSRATLFAVFVSSPSHFAEYLIKTPAECVSDVDKRVEFLRKSVYSLFMKWSGGYCCPKLLDQSWLDANHNFLLQLLNTLPK